MLLAGFTQTPLSITNEAIRKYLKVVGAGPNRSDYISIGQMLGAVLKLLQYFSSGWIRGVYKVCHSIW